MRETSAKLVVAWIIVMTVSLFIYQVKFTEKWDKISIAAIKSTRTIV